METPIYSEKQVMKLRWLLATVGIAIMLVGAYLNFNREPFGSLVMVLFAAAFGVIWLGFTTFSIVVTPTELRFGFPIFRKRFPLTTVQVGDVDKIGFLAGIGIHFWAGKWVYNARFGSGVNITHGRVRYLLGSNQPEHFQSALMQLVPRIPVGT